MFDYFSWRFGSRCAVFLAFSPLVLAPAHAADEFAMTPAQMQALGVQLQKLAAGSSTEGAAYPARVVLPPRQEQVVSAPLAGVIDQILVSENDAVRAGQPLARLSSPELGELQLKLMEAASQNRLAARTLQRERQLFGEGIIPQRRVHEAEAAAQQQQARQSQSEAALRMAGLDNATLRKVADGAAVDSVVMLRARSSGLVSQLTVKPGQRVQPADALVRIADASRLWLDVQVPLSWQAGAGPVKGLPMTVVGRESTATGQSLGATVSDSQTLMLRAEVTRGTQLLRPGEFVQVRVVMGAAQGWTVPLAAVVRQDDKAYVFVRSDKGFIAKPVTVLASAGQTVRVAGDLQAGQEVAAGSVIALKAAWQGTNETKAEGK